jgi:hypothetical protein
VNEMDKENLVYMQSGIYLYIEINFIICQTMGDISEHFAQRNNPGTKTKILHVLRYICNLKQSNERK